MRSDDGTRRYRLLLALVMAVGEESDPSAVSTVVRLALARAALDRYEVVAAFDAGTLAAHGSRIDS